MQVSETFIFANSVMSGVFVQVSDRQPDVEGDYIVRVLRNEQTQITRKRLRFGSDGKTPFWMGGCRPFSSDDQVLAWFIPGVENVAALADK